jgi:hypothetical protein
MSSPSEILCLMEPSRNDRFPATRHGTPLMKFEIEMERHHAQ